MDARCGEVGLASIRGKAQSLISGLVGKPKARRAVIDSAKVKLHMAHRELTIGKQEGGIVCDGLVEQTYGMAGLLYPASVEGSHFNEFFATEITIIGDNVCCRCLLDRGFLRRCKLRLKLVRHCFGNFALDCEDVIERPMIIFRPKMGIGSGVD